MGTTIVGESGLSPEESARKILNLSGNESPLAIEVDGMRAIWLIDHVERRWSDMHGGLKSWRDDMARYERQSEGDYNDRVNRINPDSADRLPDVFTYLNESLGTSEGFVDFFTAQARDDIFGTRPWLSVTPQGKADVDLAESMTKHASWKLGNSDLEEVLRDGIRIAAWGGTAFVKPRWIQYDEEVKQTVPAAHSIASGEPFRDAGGAYITDAKDFPADGDGDDVEWLDVLTSKTVSVFNNVNNDVLDYNDVAFKKKAKSLKLEHTDFYVRFRMGLLDLVDQFGIPLEHAQILKNHVMGHNSNARIHRDESSDEDMNDGFNEDNANPIVELVEGYLRCDLLGTGKPIRIHVIFSPGLRILFSADYLENVSPGGILPIFPLRVHKIPGRIFGQGYLEKYEAKNNSVDRKHNIISLRAKKAAHVYTSFQKDALRDPNKSFLELDPDLPIELAEGKTLAELIEFTAAPDMNDGLIRQRDAEMQMMQMQSGITSAAQGELKGVPSANTATGTNQILSRGAVLLKDNVDPITTDIAKAVEYNVHLLYANQDRDETFIWGEGRESELMEIKANDVQGLRSNVTLTLVKSQNQEKLQSATAAMEICGQWIMVPELEKPAQRSLFIQALSSLGFRNAEDIIRPATVDPAGILAILPPDMVPIMEQMMIEAGIIQAPAPDGEGQASAPTEEQASAPTEEQAPAPTEEQAPAPVENSQSK